MFLGCRDSRLIRIDPAANQAGVVSTVGVSPVGIGFGHGSVWWINSSEAGGVSRIDPASGSVQTADAPYAAFVVPTQDSIWFIDANARAFSIDPNGMQSTRPIKKGRVALGATSDKGSVLINDGGLVEFNAKTGTVTRRTHVSGTQDFQAIAGVAVLGSDIWLVDPKRQRIVAVGP
jgi:hypothetical protein